MSHKYGEGSLLTCRAQRAAQGMPPGVPAHCRLPQSVWPIHLQMQHLIGYSILRLEPQSLEDWPGATICLQTSRRAKSCIHRRVQDGM